MKIAFATDDGNKFIDRHFGDADFYEIYEIIDRKFSHIERVYNTTEEEKMHADPEKARGVSQLFKGKNVQVLCGKRFGPNIVRMKKKFVCIKVDYTEISDIFPLIIEKLPQIRNEWKKAENRDYLVLKDAKNE